RKDARLLRIGVELQVVLLVAKVDAALSLDQLGGRVDDHQVGNDDAARRMHRRDRTVDLRRLVAADQQRRRAREIEIREYEPQRAGLAAGHRDRRLAIGRGEHGGDAVACRVESRAPADAAGRPLRRCERRKDALQLDASDLEFRAGDRFTLAGIDGDMADDVAIRDAEIQRLEMQYAIVQRQMPDQAVEREPAPPGAGCAKFQIDVVIAQLDKIERLVRQYTGRRL